MTSTDQLSRQAWAEQRVLRIRYQKPEDLEVSERDVDVYGWDGVYLDTFCRLRREPRTFRVDRIIEARLLDVPFLWDPSVESLLRTHGWTGTVARPVVFKAPDRTQLEVKVEGREEDKTGGLRQWLVRLLTMGSR